MSHVCFQLSELYSGFQAGLILDHGVKTTQANDRDKRPFLSLTGARSDTGGNLYSYKEPGWFTGWGQGKVMSRSYLLVKFEAGVEECLSVRNVLSCLSRKLIKLIMPSCLDAQEHLIESKQGVQTRVYNSFYLMPQFGFESLESWSFRRLMLLGKCQQCVTFPTTQVWPTPGLRPLQTQSPSSCPSLCGLQEPGPWCLAERRRRLAR